MNTQRACIGLAAAIAVSVAACGTSTEGDSGGEVTLTWETTGGDATRQEKEAFQDPFTEKTGIQFDNVTAQSAVSQLQTMVESGNTVWDVVHTGSYLAKRYCGELFEELDLPDLEDDLYPEGTTHACTKPASKYAAVFAYDTSVYQGTVPSEIDDFFDTDTFPGKRVVYASSPRGILEAALVADGVPPDQLFPLDIDRGLAKLDTIKDDLIFAPSFTAIQQNIVDKQATMTITLTGRLSIINESGGTLAPVWDFTSWDFDALVVPKGSKHKEVAEDAIEFALQPEQVTRYAELSGSTPVREDVDPASINFSDTHKLFNAFLDDRGVLVAQDPEWWAEHNSEATEAYVGWQVG